MCLFLTSGILKANDILLRVKNSEIGIKTEVHRPITVLYKKLDNDKNVIKRGRGQAAAEAGSVKISCHLGIFHLPVDLLEPSQPHPTLHVDVFHHLPAVFKEDLCVVLARGSYEVGFFPLA